MPQLQTKYTCWLYFAAALLALAAGAFVLWQNSRVAVLWDLGYLLDTGWRIAAGQMPYRDFPLAHAPLTFLTQAVLIKIFGRFYLVTVIYAAVTGALSVWLSWLILSRLMQKRWLALALSAPLVFLSTQGVYPHPIYDTDAALAVLFAVWLLMVLAQEPEPGLTRAALTGAAVIVPIFYKQNIGLPFASAVGVAALVMLFNRSERRKAVGVLGGMVAASFVAVVAISVSFGIRNYFHWTVAFAAQRRMPGVGAIVAIYQTEFLYWALPLVIVGWALLYTRLPKIIGLTAVAAPFLWTLWLVVSYEDADDKGDAFLALWTLLIIVVAIGALMKLRGGITLARLIPFVILAAIHGTFLSQQLWGSTYAIWPLLVLLVAGWVMGLPDCGCWLKPALAVIFAVVFVVCGGIYAVSLDRLSYIDISDGPAQRAMIPALKGMATPGEYIPNFEELIAWSGKNIPHDDALLLIPGEDPFYYATGRVPRFPVTMLDPATDPYSAEELLKETERRRVKWVIVKTKLQAQENPMPEGEQTQAVVKQKFNLVQKIGGYYIYKPAIPSR